MRKECPIIKICTKAESDSQSLWPGQIATIYDQRFLGHLVNIDQLNHDGDIARCFGCEDCVMRQMFLDGTEFRQDDPHALQLPSQGNPFSGLTQEDIDREQN